VQDAPQHAKQHNRLQHDDAWDVASGIGHNEDCNTANPTRFLLLYFGIPCSGMSMQSVRETLDSKERALRLDSLVFPSGRVDSPG